MRDNAQMTKDISWVNVDRYAEGRSPDNNSSGSLSIPLDLLKTGSFVDDGSRPLDKAVLVSNPTLRSRHKSPEATVWYIVGAPASRVASPHRQRTRPWRSRARVRSQNLSSRIGTTRVGAVAIDRTTTDIQDSIQGYVQNEGLDKASSQIESNHASTHGETTHGTSRSAKEDTFLGSSVPDAVQHGANRLGMLRLSTAHSTPAQRKRRGRQRRSIEMNVNPVSACPLSPRHTSASDRATAPTVFESEAERIGGVPQAAGRSPLVPRPTTPRVHRESHPWDFSLDRFFATESCVTSQQPWRLEVGNESDSTEDASKGAGLVQLLSSRARPASSRRSKSRVRHNIRVDVDGHDDPNMEPNESPEERIITASPTKRPSELQIDTAGEGAWCRDSESDEDATRPPSLRRRRVRYLLRGRKRDPELTEMSVQLHGSSAHLQNRENSLGGRTGNGSKGRDHGPGHLAGTWGNGTAGTSWCRTGERGHLGKALGKNSTTEELSADGNEATDRDPSLPQQSTKRALLGDVGEGEFFVADGVGRSRQRSSRHVQRKQERKIKSPEKDDKEKAEEQKQDAPIMDEVKPSADQESGLDPGHGSKEAEIQKVEKKRGPRATKVLVRRLLKQARKLLRAGRVAAAHVTACELIEDVGANELSVVAYELRARIRCQLGLWVEAGEDVRAALRGLEEGQGGAADDRFSEDERDEEATLSGKQRWRAIVYRAVIRRRPQKSAGFAVLVSTVLATLRGLRARVMLVAARLLAHEGKIEAAIACIKQVRELAARRSALPGGFSGVASIVTLEAFKLEIQWLQQTSRTAEAVAVARQMTKQISRQIREKKEKYIPSKSPECTVEGDYALVKKKPKRRASPDTDGVDGNDIEKDYDASVWAQVKLATLTLQSGAARSTAKRRRMHGGRVGEKGEVRRGGGSPRTSPRGKRTAAERRRGSLLSSSKASISTSRVDADLRKPSVVATVKDEAEKLVLKRLGSLIGGNASGPAEALQSIGQPVDVGDAELLYRSGRAGKSSIVVTRHLHEGVPEVPSDHDRPVNRSDDIPFARIGAFTQPEDTTTLHDRRQTCQADVDNEIKSNVDDITHEPRTDSDAPPGIVLAGVEYDGVVHNVQGAVQLWDSHREGGPADGQGAVKVEDFSLRDPSQVCAVDTEAVAVNGSSVGMPDTQECQETLGEEEQKDNEGDEQEQENGEEDDTEEEQEEDEDEHEEEEEIPDAQKEEENRRDLEMAVGSLLSVLEDGEMAWRADIRSPRILAQAYERLADLANTPPIGKAPVDVDRDTAGTPRRKKDERSSRDLFDSSTPGKEGPFSESELPGKKNETVGEHINHTHKGSAVSLTESGNATPVVAPTRQDILQDGDRSLEGIVVGLEGRLSRLVVAWKPMWKAHQKKLRLRARREGLAEQGGGGTRGGSGYAPEQLKRKRTRDERAKATDPRSKLQESILQMLLAVVDGGFDLKTVAAPRSADSAQSESSRNEADPPSSIRPNGTTGAEMPANAANGSRLSRARRKVLRLPEELESALRQLLRVLGMSAVVFEQRAHLATAAESSPYTVTRLLEYATAYLCLPRVRPPGCVDNAMFSAAEKENGVDSGSEATIEREGNLLEWDAESLTSLVDVHKRTAAALLRSMRTPGSLRHHHDARPLAVDDLSADNANLCNRATESLTTALAAAGVGRLPSFPCPDDEFGEIGIELASGWPLYSKDTTHQGLLPACDNNEDFTCYSPAHVGVPPSPEASRAERGHKEQTNVQQQEPSRSPSGIAEKSNPGRQKGLWHIGAAAPVVAISTPESIAELYAMRCSAREQSGLTELAFRDAQNASALKPATPKLVAKAASLALRLSHEVEKRGGVGVSVAVRRGWAETVRLASELLSLCPRSFRGFLIRAQGLEKLGQYTQAMRDYCRAQHTYPWSPLPELLRARLASRHENQNVAPNVDAKGGTPAGMAVRAVGAFLSSPSVLAGTCSDDAESSIDDSLADRVTAGAPVRLQETKVWWWRGRCEELNEDYYAASDNYEMVCEKRPTVAALNQLASCYLRSNRPIKAEQLLCKVVEQVTAVNHTHAIDTVNSSPEVSAIPSAASAGALSKGYTIAVDSTFLNTACRQELSRARVLHSRALFALGKDELYYAFVKSTLQGAAEDATDLYEMALCEAISACMRSASKIGSCSDNADDDMEGVTNVGSEGGPATQAMAAVAVEKTGIDPWDKSILDEARRIARKNRQEESEEFHMDAVEIGQCSPHGALEQPAASAIHLQMLVCGGTSDGQASVSVCAERWRGMTKSTNQQPRGGEDTGSPAASGESLEAQSSSMTEASIVPLQEQGGVDGARQGSKNPRGLQSALKLVTRCLDIDGTLAKAYVLRAEIEGRLGRKDRAIADFEAAALLNVGDVRPSINQEIIHLGASKAGRAQQELDDLEKLSSGPALKAVVAYNLGVAAATMGALEVAEGAFTRALEAIISSSVPDCEKIVSPSACLANRGLVRFALGLFRDSVEDLGGSTAQAPESLPAKNITARVNSPTAATAAAAVGKGEIEIEKRIVAAGRGEGALRSLDCGIGRALAEGRTETKECQEAAVVHLWHLLRFNRLLSCEVVAVRLALGNLAAQSSECPASERFSSRNLANPDSPSTASNTTPDSHLRDMREVVKNGTEKRYRNRKNMALRHFLHAIHACPTASAAWLNAAEVLATIADEEWDGASHSERHDPGSIRPIGSTPSQVLLERTASLALLDSVTTMTPRHAVALRCHAAALTTLGLHTQAVARADLAVSVAQKSARTLAKTSYVISNTSSCFSEAHGTRRKRATAGLDENKSRTTNADSTDKDTSRAIGFMSSSKIPTSVGGLLLTGGGTCGMFEFAASLALRGCIQQKMGRRKAALGDNHRALDACRHLMDEHSTKHSGNRRNYPANGGLSPMSKVWRLEALIQHNLATLHIAAIRCGDPRVAFHKAAAVAEAERFTTCEKLANGWASDQERTLRCRHAWWHLTVLAVARIMGTVDGLYTAQRQGWPTDDNHSKAARLLLGSAEAAVAEQSGGFEHDTVNAGYNAPNEGRKLEGGARALAQLAIYVNLSAAEKIKAHLARKRGDRNEGGLARAIECITDAIHLDPSRPELYVERGGLLAKSTSTVVVDGCVKHAAADFATALQLDGDVRRYQPGFAQPTASSGNLKISEQPSRAAHEVEELVNSINSCSL